MNRESIIIIICIGVVALFYLFQVDNAPKKEIGLVEKPVVQSTNNITKKVLQQKPKAVFTTTSDSLDNKGNKPK